jgi:hypothetical protein
MTSMQTKATIGVLRSSRRWRAQAPTATSSPSTVNCGDTLTTA